MIQVGDCFDILPTLPDGAFDHVITDPPYSDVTHDGARTTTPGGELNTIKLVTFPPIGEEEFLRLCRECVRVAKRWVVMTCDWRHAIAAERALPEAFVRLGIWVKPDAAPQFTGDRPGTGWEAVLMLHRPGRKKWNGGGHHATWRHGVQRQAEHPTQKPLGLVRQWVTQFTDISDRILDPFAGAGTTGVACILEGRQFHGIEGNAEYAAIAERRIAAAKEDAEMFGWDQANGVGA